MYGSSFDFKGVDVPAFNMMLNVKRAKPIELKQLCHNFNWKVTEYLQPIKRRSKKQKQKQEDEAEAKKKRDEDFEMRYTVWDQSGKKIEKQKKPEEVKEDIENTV